MDHLCHYIVRAALFVVHRVENLLDEIADDTLVQRGLEADLGLPEGTLDRKKLKSAPPPTTAIEQYVHDVDADAEKLAVAVDNIKAYAKFWTDVFDAAETEPGSVVASEALYRLFQYATTDLIKFEHPSAYAVLRLLRVIGYDTLTAFDETFAPESAAGIFTADH